MPTQWYTDNYVEWAPNAAEDPNTYWYGNGLLDSGENMYVAYDTDPPKPPSPGKVHPPSPPVPPRPPSAPSVTPPDAPRIRRPKAPALPY